ncbi:unnamed protein product [Adineta steineri]|uniref:Uncharacterized protein n=1 Tax=Adineta steineri TaxID=433720 RepID=A0A813RP74_9BILA|nr:unnamed protein product [Adineta steineri]CAF3669962.1 unnamed protein product [Adineta steineri]
MATNECIVHTSKYRSKFNHAVNLIRRDKNYEGHVYYELSKRYCSCYGKKGLNIIDLNVLINICDEIVLNRLKEPKIDKTFYVCTLPFESEVNFRQRQARIGRFVGKKGETLIALQDKYDVHVYLINKRSNRGFIKRCLNLKDLGELHYIIYGPNQYVLIKRKNKLMLDTIPIDEIKQEIIKKWEETNESQLLEREMTFDQNQFQIVSLSFIPRPYRMFERYETMERFLGEKNENLHKLEDQYNVRLHVIKNDCFCFKYKYFQKLLQIQENNFDQFFIVITKKNKSITNEIPIDEIKERITKQWKMENIELINSDESFPFMSLSFDPNSFIPERIKKVHLFIGRNGQNLYALQEKYCIYIEIIYKYSNKNIPMKSTKFLDKEKLHKVYLLITNKDKSTMNEIHFDQIKREIINRWKKIKEIDSATNMSYSNHAVPSKQPDFDYQWHEQKYRRRK